MSTNTLWKLYWISSILLILSALVFLGLAIYVFITNDYAYNHLWFSIPLISGLISGTSTIYIIQTISHKNIIRTLDKIISTIDTINTILPKKDK
jgi:type II secretory pathway component PulF